MFVWVCLFTENIWLASIFIYIHMFTYAKYARYFGIYSSFFQIWKRQVIGIRITNKFICFYEENQVISLLVNVKTICNLIQSVLIEFTVQQKRQMFYIHILF